MTEKRSARPYGKIEIIEEVHPNQSPTEAVLVRPRAVLINGQEIYVAEDGIYIDTGGKDSSVTSVTIEVMPDDVHIRRVPAGYIDRAHHLYTLEKEAHRIADIGIVGKIRRLFQKITPPTGRLLRRIFYAPTPSWGGGTFSHHQGPA